MGRYKKLNFALLISCAFLTGMVVWGTFHGIQQEVPIPASELVRESGGCYTTTLPASRYWLFENLADNQSNASESKTELFEEGKPLGPAHSAHDVIRSKGAGRFSHWGSKLYFSTSDNSDPRTNGRVYRAVIKSTSPVWVLAVLMPFLLIPLYLNREMVRRLVGELFVESDPSIEQEAAPSASTQSVSALATSRKIRWRWGVLAAVALALLSLYPQIDLWITRGTVWQGSFTSLCYDEEIYAAYINGLVLGRERRVEPLEVPDPAQPSHESHYSIQAVPAYLTVFLTRALGLTVAQAFIVLTPLTAFLSALMLFYLLASITRNEALAAVGALAVLIFGTLAARHSVALGWVGKSWYGNFLFLRRYQPAIIFPVFLGFLWVTWRGFIEQGRRAWLFAIAAGIAFSILIFSYFYLWTAAAAWLACLVLLWLVARGAEWRMVVQRLVPTAILGSGALAIYAVLFAHRDHTMNEVLALNFTHAPDLYRAPLLIAAAVILLLFWGVKKEWVTWREPAVLLACSFALMPFAVFNQQIITGRSLQPVHYEMFSANYLSLLALILALVMLWPSWGLHLKRHALNGLTALLACVVIGWGVVEMQGVTSQFRERNITRDLFVPVTKRLTQLAAEHGKGPNEREIVFSPDMLVVSENLAAFAPQAPLFSMSLSFAAGLSLEESRERYFQYLYYSGARTDSLRQALTNNEMVAVMSSFGYERYNPTLTNDFKPITSEEIQDKVRQYTQYVANFSRERSQHPQLAYVVVNTAAPFDFSNIDRWYSRDAGEQIGPFIIYQVKLSKLPELDPSEAKLGN